MACSSQPGAAPFVDYIEAQTGERLSARDWHDVKKLAAAEGADVSRRRLTQSEMSESFSGFIRSLPEVAVDDPEHQGRVDDYLKARDELADANITAGTMAIIDYLAKHGVEETLRDVRASRKAPKEVKDDAPSAQPVPSKVTRTQMLEEVERAATGEWDAYDVDGRIGMERIIDTGSGAGVATIDAGDYENPVTAEISLTVPDGYDGETDTFVLDSANFDSVEEARDWVDEWETNAVERQFDTLSEASESERDGWAREDDFLNPPF